MTIFSATLIVTALWAIHVIFAHTWAHRPSLWTTSSSRDDHWILWLQ